MHRFPHPDVSPLLIWGRILERLATARAASEHRKGHRAGAIPVHPISNALPAQEARELNWMAYGGTGSAVGEQLIRLGVGKVTTWDPDSISETNLTRLYGSRVADVEMKVAVAERLAKEVGLGTSVSAIPKAITTGTAFARCEPATLSFVAPMTNGADPCEVRKLDLIPVLDLGVKVPSTDGLLGTVAGRVSILKQGQL